MKILGIGVDLIKNKRISLLIKNIILSKEHLVRKKFFFQN